MTRVNNVKFFKWVLFVFVLFVALYCRELNENRTLLVSTMLGVIQTTIYVGLVTVWGLSIQYRIVPIQIRRSLESMCVLLIIWFLERGTKYYALKFVAHAENISRYLWYSYYIPMLFLPVILLMVACLLRKPEKYRLPHKTVLSLLNVSTVMFALVVTNDFHQLVFSFPKEATVFSDEEYSYGIGYYICLAWMVSCIVAALIIMIRKCRLPNTNKVLWMPLIPMGICIIYVVAYITGYTAFFNDIIIVDSFLLIAILELAITVGLIPSNSSYEKLFKASNLSAFITDQNLTTIAISDDAKVPENKILKEAIGKGSLTEKGVRISAYRVNDGYAFWQEDVTELYTLIDTLEELNLELVGKRDVLQEAYDTKHKRQSLVEKNRLYNIMQNQTKDKVTKLYSLAKQLEVAEDEEKIIKLTDEIAIISAYLKRRNNLIFIAEENERLAADELIYCLNESITNLKSAGINCEAVYNLKGEMLFKNVTEIYDAFQEAVERALPDMLALFINVSMNKDEVVLTMNMQSNVNLYSLENYGFSVSQDFDNEWSLEYVLSLDGDFS